MDLENVKNAFDVLREARNQHYRSGKHFRVGIVRVSKSNSQLIKDALQHPMIRDIAATLDSRESLERLFGRAAEFLRCQKLLDSLTKKMKLDLYKLLSVHLLVNSRLLEMQPKKVISATILIEPLVSDILDEIEFEWCREIPSVIRRAVVNSPSDPRGFLREVKIRADEILSEEEFAWCREIPGMIRHVLMHYSLDPRQVLRTAREVTIEILSEMEFSWCAKSPNLVLKAAIYNPSDPRRSLRQLETTMNEILAKEEFTWCRDTPWVVRDAIVGYPSDPSGFLRIAKKTETAIFSLLYAKIH